MIVATVHTEICIRLRAKATTMRTQTKLSSINVRSYIAVFPSHDARVTEPNSGYSRSQGELAETPSTPGGRIECPETSSIMRLS